MSRSAFCRSLFGAGRTCSLWFVCWSLAVSGCSKKPDGQLPVHAVTGHVTVGGQGVAGVSVILYPESENPAAAKRLNPSGITDDQGNYRLTTYSQNDGAPDGAYKVTLLWLDQPPASAKGPPAGFAPPQDKFRSRYVDPARTTWKVTISPEMTELPVIEVPKLPAAK